MQRGVFPCLLLALSSMVWAQDSGAKPSSSTSSPPAAPGSSSTPGQGNASAHPFPEDDPASTSGGARQAPPRSDSVQVQDLGGGSGESSSKDTGIDLSPPADDAKTHPQSSSAVANAEAASLTPGGIVELQTWDPHKAAKDVEVGDFYFKRQNYRAAEDRYREALRYKDNDAIATIKLAVCLEKLGVLDDARAEYESYLKILPHGPQASEAQKALARLKAATGAK